MNQLSRCALHRAVSRNGGSLEDHRSWAAALMVTNQTKLQSKIGFLELRTPGVDTSERTAANTSFFISIGCGAEGPGGETGSRDLVLLTNWIERIRKASGGE
jgi:hypothetical protein